MYQSVELHDSTKICSGFPKIVFSFFFLLYSDVPLVKLMFPQLSAPQASLGRAAAETKLQALGRSGSKTMADV